MGRRLSVTGIVDLMNAIGRCVIAGEVRQTTEIAFGPSVPEYLDLKHYGTPFPPTPIPLLIYLLIQPQRLGNYVFSILV